MIDIFADDVTLIEIQQKQGEVLVFKNKCKDEILAIPVANEELINIFHKVKMRCETLGLILIQGSGEL